MLEWHDRYKEGREYDKFASTKTKFGIKQISYGESGEFEREDGEDDGEELKHTNSNLEAAEADEEEEADGINDQLFEQEDGFFDFTKAFMKPACELRFNTMRML